MGIVKEILFVINSSMILNMKRTSYIGLHFGSWRNNVMQISQIPQIKNDNHNRL